MMIKRVIVWLQFLINLIQYFTTSWLDILSGNFDMYCPFCFEEEETTTHLFIKCKVAVSVWNMLMLGWDHFEYNL